MFTLVAVLILAVPALAAISAVSSRSGGEKVACTKFKLKYPEQTYYPGSGGYTYETQSGKNRSDVA